MSAVAPPISSSPRPSPRFKSIMGVASRGFFISIYLIGLLCVFHPSLRNYIRGALNKEFRQILASASGPLLSEGGVAKVIKIRTSEGIFLEIYGRTPEGTRPLLARIQLPDRRDGYFSFGKVTSNLFIHDIDSDNIPEIVAPTFDESLMAHLNIYSFNPITLKIEPKTRSLSSP